MASKGEISSRKPSDELETRRLTKATKMGEVIRNAVGAHIEHRLAVTVLGHENLEKLHGSGAIVVVAPHNGHIDTPLVRMAFEDTYKKLLFFVAAADYWEKAVHKENDTFKVRFKNTLFTYMRRLFSPGVARIFPIDRFNPAQASYDLEQIAEKVLAGEFAVLFPEGTRSRDANKPISEREFKSGLGLLVLMTEGKVPIVPVYLEGNEKLMPPHSNKPELQKDGVPHQVTVHIGEPIATSSLVQKPPTEMENQEIRAFRRMATDMVHGYFVGMYEDTITDPDSKQPY